MPGQRIKLGDIASITTGLVVKRKQADLPGDIVRRYQMLTLKSFEQDGWLNGDELEEFNGNEIIDGKYLTQRNDVVIRLSHPNTAITMEEGRKGVLIPSLFAVIRLKTDILLAQYLSIYLNSDQNRRFYATRATGSAIQIIKTSILKEIEVKLPALEQQRKLVDIYRLMSREKQLLKKLIAEKEKYHIAIINGMI